uniref:Complex I assembly factor TIMMDC1, mitochondrial n=1 Tax=Tabanus bromius TaxID=304241 RepID=A0A0K8TKI9_TABBR
MNRIIKMRRILPFGFAGLLPFDWSTNDIVSKDTKTSKAFESARITETGQDRLKRMFQSDDLGTVSSELNSIYQAGYLGAFIGGLYGGILNSRIAYLNFMENNQATAFKSHLDAKRKLQDSVTMSFAKGAFKWGWRIGLFTTCYAGITTCVSVYRGKSSIYEYLAAGSVTGALYKVNMGLKGMAAGGIVGLALGGVAGTLSLLLLKATGTTMEEVRYWQYNWKLERDAAVRESIKAQIENPPEINQAHDSKVGEKKITLDNV